MPFVNFQKKSLLFLRFSQEFRCSNISAVTEHTRNQIFLINYPKIFFQNLYFGPIRWVPRRFLKILIIYSQNLHFTLVFTEHMRNEFNRTLSIRETNIFAC
jgi:hypothetical protein